MTSLAKTINQEKKLIIEIFYDGFFDDHSSIKIDTSDILVESYNDIKNLHHPDFDLSESSENQWIKASHKDQNASKDVSASQACKLMI